MAAIAIQRAAVGVAAGRGPRSGRAFAAALSLGLSVRDARASAAALSLSLGLCLGLAAACGSSGPGAGPAPGQTAPAVIATPALTADDAPVASVNGRTVWASCVAAQARAIGDDARTDSRTDSRTDARRAAALDQCIRFELLAQAAEARGLAGSPEVAEAARGAAVNRLVEVGFEQRYRTPADMAPQVAAVMKGNEWRLHVAASRASYYARFAVPDHAPAAVETQARALAEQLAAELAGQTGLFGVNVADAAQRLDQGTGITLNLSAYRPAGLDTLVEAYGKALYAIPAVGQTSPAFRSPWGWDVVLWTGGVEARDRSRDDLIAELFPELRRREFVRWVDELGKRLGIRIEIAKDVDQQLDPEAEPPDREDGR